MAKPPHSVALAGLMLAAFLTLPATADEADATTGQAPLSLESEVMVPDLSAGEPRVALPPVVPGPSFLEGLELAPVVPESEPAPEAPVIPEVPSVVIAPAEPIAPPPVTALTVTLDWYLNPQHAVLLIAREKGLFQRHGLSVTLTPPADPNVPAKLLAAGRTDLALGRQPLLHLAVDQGQPLVRVATLIDTPLTGVVLREAEPDVAPPADDDAQADDRSGTPRALRLGYTVADNAALLSSPLGTANSLLPERLELVDINYAVLDAMRDDTLDGVVVNQRHLLARQLADEGVATQVLRLEEHGLPLHDGLILMANRDQLAAQRDAIREFITALEEAGLWMLNHPEAAWQLMTAAEPALNDPIMRDAWEAIYPRLSQRPAAIDQGRYARFEEQLFNAGLVETQTPVERLAVDLGTPAP